MNVPVVTRRSACYLVLLGILILELAGMLWELPRLQVLQRLPTTTIHVRYNIDGNGERSADIKVTDGATNATTITTTTTNSTTMTAWCILDRNNTPEYFRHFPHALQSLAPCWSYFCRQREKLKQENIRCGIYLPQPLRFPWKDMSAWTVQLVEAMGCRVAIQPETKNTNVTTTSEEPFGNGDVRYRVPDYRVFKYAFFEKKEDVQQLQARVLGDSAEEAVTDAGSDADKERILRIGIVQRVRTGWKQKPSRIFLNVPDLRSALESAFPDAAVDETDQRGFSLKEQAAWWHHHDVVIAAHGAALANAIFLRSTASVIEVYPDGFHPYIFGALLKSAGVHRITIDSNASVARGKDSDLRPDPELVVRLVRQAIGGPLATEPAESATGSTSAPLLPSPSSPSPPRGPVAYTRMRIDRSGSVLHDLLHAHAYCFKHNLTYGGSCAVDATAHQRSNESQQLVDFLGLSDELKLACPYAGSLTRSINATTDGDNDNDSFVVLHPNQYKHDELFTSEWLSYVNARRNVTETTTTTTTDYDNAPLQVAVYLRRGDVTPCFGLKRGPKFWRYLPNSYYLGVLDQYLPHDRPASVTIHSLSNSPAEDFAAFRERNYTVLLDAPISQVWEALMTADMAVLSKSSFSYIPAMFNTRGTVLYTDFWHEPLPGWVRINRTIQEQGVADLRSLHDVLCPSIGTARG